MHLPSLGDGDMSLYYGGGGGDEAGKQAQAGLLGCFGESGVQGCVLLDLG